MALNMRTSQAGLDVIKAFEGFRPRAESMPDGRWIIGYGHVRRARQGLRVNESEAEAILREYDLPPVERFVQDCVLAPLTQNEFDALVSLAFNIGGKAFASSDVVANLNSGNRLTSAEAFDHWRCAKIGGRVQIVDALVRRRAAEKALFLKAPGQMPVASSRFYRALHDKTGLSAPPRPREILVEHHGKPSASPRLERSSDAAPKRQRSATEEAAESVRRQMQRILGEDGANVSEPVDMTDGASPEEITAAVSELARETERSGVRKSVWPQQEDLPPPPHFEREITESKKPTSPQTTRRLADIDDLEEVKVSPESIARAIEINEEIEAEGRGGSMLEALPFGFLALVGVLLATYGILDQVGVVGGDPEFRSGFAAALPIILMATGGVLFLIMFFFFVRALVRRG